METLSALCPLCSSGETNIICQRENEKQMIVACNNCQLEFINPMPAEEQVRKSYDFTEDEKNQAQDYF